MKKVKVLWHQPSNYLAVVDDRDRAGLPLLTVIDEEFTGINPFYSYPLTFLKMWGWIEIGEL